MGDMADFYDDIDKRNDEQGHECDCAAHQDARLTEWKKRASEAEAARDTQLQISRSLADTNRKLEAAARALVDVAKLVASMQPAALADTQTQADACGQFYARLIELEALLASATFDECAAEGKTSAAMEPCPYCKSSPKTRQYEDGDFVQCSMCGARGARTFNEAHAIEEWNAVARLSRGGGNPGRGTGAG